MPENQRKERGKTGDFFLDKIWQLRLPVIVLIAQEGRERRKEERSWLTSSSSDVSDEKLR